MGLVKQPFNTFNASADVSLAGAVCRCFFRWPRSLTPIQRTQAGSAAPALLSGRKRRRFIEHLRLAIGADLAAPETHSDQSSRRPLPGTDTCWTPQLCLPRRLGYLLLSRPSLVLPNVRGGHPRLLGPTSIAAPVRQLPTMRVQMCLRSTLPHLCHQVGLPPPYQDRQITGPPILHSTLIPCPTMRLAHSVN